MSYMEWGIVSIETAVLCWRAADRLTYDQHTGVFFLRMYIGEREHDHRLLTAWIAYQLYVLRSPDCKANRVMESVVGFVITLQTG